ncbi:hypothetical protein [Catenovulum sediminis]|uniref:Orphan protein n=1 Tax=Catenovulum sediminis TaxID=1740262 RepID=A0ABV1RCU3_9ALTE|nr:hypothetical protein [Catenovulum sediminis]
MPKTRYLLTFLALLFAALTFFSFYFYWQENEPLLKKANQQAIANASEFAKSHNQLQCLHKVIEQSESCRDSNCTLTLKNYLVTCFQQAEKNPQVCEKMPDAHDYLAKVSWSVSTCRKAKVKNGNCTHIINELPLLCAQSHNAGK